MPRQQSPRFPDRPAAGRALATELLHQLGPPAPGAVVVLALPRGGVPVAAPIAAALQTELDVLIVRKLGLPAQPELAMGAIAGVDGAIELVRNERVLGEASVPAPEFDAVLAAESAALREREQRYRPGRSASVPGRVVVLVDDGLATGSTMQAAVAAVRRREPAAIVVAVPVGPPSTCAALERDVDRLVCLQRPERFRAVGEAYDDFSPTSDEEVRAALAGPQSS